MKRFANSVYLTFHLHAKIPGAINIQLIPHEAELYGGSKP